MQFKDIPGHDLIKRRLMLMVDDNRLPHALLISGIPGIGKLALARALAQYVHCTRRIPGVDSCGTCPSCLQHKGLNHIDTIYSYPVIKRDGSRPTVSDDYADEWREYLDGRTYMDFPEWNDFIRGKSTKQSLISTDDAHFILRKVATTTHASDRKIVIVWLPERMNDSGANSLLKIIEEPYDDTSFILVSDRPADIISTIRSRCQSVEVPRLPDNVIAESIAARGVDPADAMAMAHIADGSMAEAMRQMNQSGEAKRLLDTFTSLMRLAYTRNVAALRAWADDLAGTGREAEINFYNYAERLIRENFIYNFGNDSLVYLNRDEEAFSSRFARFITERNAQRLAEAMSKAAIDIAANGNGKIVNFDLAIRVILLLK